MAVVMSLMLFLLTHGFDLLLSSLISEIQQRRLKQLSKGSIW